jgi:hypothetical protein
MTKANRNHQQFETIEVNVPEQDMTGRWQPSIGGETLQFLQHLDIPHYSKEVLTREATSILAHCVPPAEVRGTETGLIIGYVQSGKTMSFTALTALARDNGYRLVIVITGTTVNLFNQSSERLQRDLRLRERTDRQWQFLTNPNAWLEIRQRLSMAVDWDNMPPGANKQTVLMTVMKNARHLDNLNALLSQTNLRGVPALIIDDEADQASLNNLVRQGSQSAIYSRILRLRSLLPHHTFLQYTATPQALLLINLIDTLSPGFVELLTPGPTYTGGRTFFEADFRLVRTIPANEIPSRNQTLSEPPDSLLQALRIFYLGVAVDIMLRGGQGNRSMMVHPAKQTQQHGNYIQWIRAIQENWRQTLTNTVALNNAEPDREELLEDFRASYDDLRTTIDQALDFGEVARFLPAALRNTVITEVNTARGRTPLPDWHQDHSNILVGGEVLNRGYTVEGLTVTYIPRSAGVGNADTIEQRARWFGYKAEYLGFCRVYLAAATLAAYRNYVEHEENIRQQLREHAASGQSLKDWRRAFFLAPALQPTRRAVLDLDYVRGNYANNWFEPRAPHDPIEAAEANKVLVSAYLASLAFAPDEGDPRRTEAQKHLVARTSLATAYHGLLIQLRIASPSDSLRFAGLLLQISRFLDESSGATCTIYYMSSGIVRERTLDSEGEILQLFQGANPSSSSRKQDRIYPGDREIHPPDQVTIQIHNLRLTQDNSVIADNIPAVAVWLPRSVSAAWIIQDQPGRANG